MRLLAVDQGSHGLGIASYQDGAWRGTWLIRAPSGRAHRERLHYLGAELRQLARVLTQDGLEPDLIAIEDVVIHRNHPNLQGAGSMFETRGYLTSTLHDLYPTARIVDVHPSQTKSAVGAPRDREGAKRHTMTVVRGMLGRTDLSEDEADAVAVGLAALAKVRTAELAAMANGGPR